MSAPEESIDQFVHGYDRGHRLLAGSMKTPGKLITVLNSRSDAAPNYRFSTGPYLSGYPLPDGSWALARTWPALDAHRPNTVWTHTLVVPGRLIGRVSAGALDALFRRPDHGHGFDQYRRRIPLADLRDRPVACPPHLAGEVALLYHEREVVIDEAAADHREAAALALWDQHWVPVRRSFAFCTAPGVPMSEDSRHHILRFGAHSAGQHSGSHIPDVVVEDLLRPSPFREWVHFVGSGESDRSLIDTFAAVYALLGSSSEGDPIERAESLLSIRGGTRDLRRLKRRLLSFDAGSPRWQVPPQNVLSALAQGRLGTLTAAEDASLNDWIAASWQADPQGTLQLLLQPASADVTDSTDRLRPASLAIAGSLGELLAGLLTPATVELAATVLPDRLLPALSERNDVSLWEAWADLPERLLQDTARGAFPRPADWSVVVDATRGRPLAARVVLERHPSVIDDYVSALIAQPSPVDHSLYPVPDTAAMLLVEGLRTETRGTHIRALATLARPTILPKSVEWKAWRAVLDQDDAGPTTATAYALGRRSSGKAGLELAGIALARLYPALAKGKATPAWLRLSGVIAGDRNDWDHCRRLARDFAKAVGKQNDDTAAHLIAVVHAHHPAAAAAVVDVLRSSKTGSSVWKSLSNLLPW